MNIFRCVHTHMHKHARTRTERETALHCLLWLLFLVGWPLSVCHMANSWIADDILMAAGSRFHWQCPHAQVFRVAVRWMSYAGWVVTKFRIILTRRSMSGLLSHVARKAYHLLLSMRDCCPGSTVDRFRCVCCRASATTIVVLWLPFRRLIYIKL